MLLFLRILPFLIGLSQGLLFWLQWKQSMTYPFFVLLGCVLCWVAAIMIGWRRLTWVDFLEKMAPVFILQFSLAFSLLFVESSLALWSTMLLAGVSSFLSLELLFLLVFEPTAYPVSGLSRLHMSFVPLIIWHAVSTSIGLLTFIHLNQAFHLLLCAVLSGVLFRTTGHPGASFEQNRVWTVVGILAGVQVGWLGLHLPLSMPMQGLVAAVLLTALLRVRRYVHQPRPAVAVAWTEVGITCFLFSVALVTTKWL